MPTLYFSPGSAAMAPHAAFLEAGAPLEIVKIERENGVITSPANYKELNPHGRVPALVDGDLRLYESAAIVLHVADRYPQSGLLPASGSDARSLATRWLVHLTNTVQPQFIAVFGAARIVGADASPELLAEVKTGAQTVLAQQWDWLDSELAGKQYLLGDTFSAADLYLFMLTRWGRILTPPSWDRPNIAAHYARLAARSSVAAMLEQQGIEAYPA